MECYAVEAAIQLLLFFCKFTFPFFEKVKKEAYSQENKGMYN
jgi:hypothetical protein